MLQDGTKSHKTAQKSEAINEQRIRESVALTYAVELVHEGDVRGGHILQSLLGLLPQLCQNRVI